MTADDGTSVVPIQGRRFSGAMPMSVHLMQPAPTRAGANVSYWKIIIEIMSHTPEGPHRPASVEYRAPLHHTARCNPANWATHQSLPCGEWLRQRRDALGLVMPDGPLVNVGAFLKRDALLPADEEGLRAGGDDIRLARVRGVLQDDLPDGVPRNMIGSSRSSVMRP